MKFKRGDKVICINADNEKFFIKENETYTVNGVMDMGEVCKISLGDDPGYKMYNVLRFMKFNEYRRNKLLKIKDEIRKRRHSDLY